MSEAESTNLPYSYFFFFSPGDRGGFHPHPSPSELDEAEGRKGNEDEKLEPTDQKTEEARDCVAKSPPLALPLPSSVAKFNTPSQIQQSYRPHASLSFFSFLFFFSRLTPLSAESNPTAALYRLHQRN